jgi:hypothetical protein
MVVHGSAARFALAQRRSWRRIARALIVRPRARWPSRACAGVASTTTRWTAAWWRSALRSTERRAHVDVNARTTTTPSDLPRARQIATQCRACTRGRQIR